jgi:hypothetical protein
LRIIKGDGDNDIGCPAQIDNKQDEQGGYGRMAHRSHGHVQNRVVLRQMFTAVNVRHAPAHQNRGLKLHIWNYVTRFHFKFC